ncbi:arylformamidase [Pararhizobium capsulatum DSM 1112]|uniref:Arylformamidase n=1 Tax=Pararhizobium capsulatum DSM 1112 TaxID=1121113 RepID=A0ABU0C005_9HYPH|nr:alpha/beta hydrolase [Pararhizobium capsulatum]MDQ0323015.1 arylformamidase [Pararhizobium capsulatum DSM 1112]
MENDPFRIRAHVAEFDAIVEETVASSARTRDRVPMAADVQYGDGPSETIDIFFPEGSRENLPVHMFIHGGYWRMFSKRDYSYVANTVTNAGAIAVIVDYALMPSVRMSVLVDQVRRAKRWVVDTIHTYGGDTSRLTVSGHSAGAHLATFLFNRQEERSGFAAAFLLGGLYDLKPLQKSFLADEIGITDEEVLAFSPMLQTFDRDCRVTVAVGADETPPFHKQASDFVMVLEMQGQAVSKRSIIGANHMSSVRDLGLPTSPTGMLLNEMIVRAV